ncbi:MAG: MBL fold metallo-hydrolase [Chitinophagaceae bacterium]|nr:MAG: MBL fold metallo-hydrolase [Chitinophagaceae bacterium]
MSLSISALNSGSNGNCYYVGNQQEAVLIDVGISCTAVEKRLAGLQIPIDRVKAVFVSHEHTDHTKGVSTFANKYGLPVYISVEAARNGPRLIRHLSQTLRPQQPVAIGTLEVIAFNKCHDANEPFSFAITCDHTTVGVFTDHGRVCDDTIHYFKKCHAAFLESNYDAGMLHNGPYSDALKARIRGGLGHLSNAQALDLFTNHRPAFMSHLILSHISSRNNTPQLVQQLFSPHAGNTQIILASRQQATALYEIGIAATLKSPQA